MIKWMKTRENPDQWIIQRKGKTYPIKNLETLFVYSLAFNVKIEAIEEAVLYMEKNNHNYAEFGFSGKFVFSDKKN